VIRAVIAFARRKEDERGGTWKLIGGWEVYLFRGSTTFWLGPQEEARKNILAT
jgi:hypothetical protein